MLAYDFLMKYVTDYEEIVTDALADSVMITSLQLMLTERFMVAPLIIFTNVDQFLPDSSQTHINSI